MNQMRYYVDASGVYLGGWDASPPEGAIEVPFPPEDARQVWVAAQEAYAPPKLALPDLAPWQFRAMLHLSGKQADLEAFIDGLPEPASTVARAKLEYTLVFQRNNDLVLTAQQALGLTEQQLDALWTQALSL